MFSHEDRTSTRRMQLAFALLLAVAPAASHANNDRVDSGLAPATAATVELRYRPENSHYVAEIFGMPQLYNHRVLRTDMMRRAMPTIEPHLLFSFSDPAMAKRFADASQPSRYAHFKLDIDGLGMVKACGMDDIPGSAPDVELIAEQCPALVKRAKFYPALDMAGHAVTDVYRISITFGHHGAQTGLQPSAIRKRLLSPSPPPPPPAFDKAQSWPLKSWMLRYQNKPSFQRPVLTGVTSATIPPDEIVIGVVIQRDRINPVSCIAVNGFAAVIQGQRACDFVVNKLKPAWAVGDRYSTQYPLLVVGNGRSRRVIEPATKTEFQPQLDPVAAAETLRLVQAALLPSDRLSDLALWLEVGADGKVMECRIAASAGSIAGDIAACQAIQDYARFTPGQDVFGQPLPQSSAGWNAAYARAAAEKK